MVVEELWPQRCSVSLSSFCICLCSAFLRSHHVIAGLVDPTHVASKRPLIIPPPPLCLTVYVYLLRYCVWLTTLPVKPHWCSLAVIDFNIQQACSAWHVAHFFSYFCLISGWICWDVPSRKFGSSLVGFLLVNNLSDCRTLNSALFRKGFIILSRWMCSSSCFSKAATYVVPSWHYVSIHPNAPGPSNCQNICFYGSPHLQSFHSSRHCDYQHLARITVLNPGEALGGYLVLFIWFFFISFLLFIQ